MIPNFFNTVQQDITCVSEYFTRGTPATKEQEQKTGKAALRMLAVLGMALACVYLAGAFTAVTAGAALSKLAVAVAFYVLSHDLFIMLVNSEKDLVDQVVAIGKGVVADVVDLVTGKKILEDGFRHPHSEGTFLRPFWDKVLWGSEE